MIKNVSKHQICPYCKEKVTIKSDGKIFWVSESLSQEKEEDEVYDFPKGEGPPQLPKSILWAPQNSPLHLAVKQIDMLVDWCSWAEVQIKTNKCFAVIRNGGYIDDFEERLTKLEEKDD